ncbi:MAG TPA: UbiD family decarboxylase [Planctomycetaceae bacterium]|jgi:4-hydroxy-3-polyprenylbenzoate decarboxylase|nr:UbiD family decarboxylase [Planctomycetaceae bacterium]
MGYRILQDCVRDLERSGQLVRIETEIDPYLQAAEIQRRVYQAQGPALFYARVKGCRFPMVSNLFGTRERTRFLFRDTLESVRRLIALKIDPADAWKRPWHYRGVPAALWTMRPKRVRTGPVLQNRTTIDQLPQLVNWPKDAGAFVTLPEVYTENQDRPGFAQSNLGMYRIQLSGGQYAANREVGLHYQIHRSIGVHHAAAIRRGERLRANIFVGGTPAMMLAAVMPLPEGLSELTFAGALAGRRIPMVALAGHLPVYAEADFCISGTVDPNKLLPEGPFGDHLGYYSLAHDFPVLEVDAVYHRRDAIWPFTVVGRPPQEDTSFGELIHDLTGPLMPSIIPGVHAVHAVDAAGVHPLLLAIGSERYVPYAGRRKPQELLTNANAILGQGQLSLAKYLVIVAREDDPQLDIHNIPAFFAHVLSRVDWTTDLHFQTCTTLDTLDYSSCELNAGSKLVIAAAGPPRRQLPTSVPPDLSLPDGFRNPRLCLPGILALEAPPFARAEGETESAVERFCGAIDPSHPINGFPLIVLVDDSEFANRSLNNFLWTTFTRSNPAADVHGIGPFTREKHWGCRGALVIDARLKPQHAPPLVEDPAVTKSVDQLAAPSGPLHRII